MDWDDDTEAALTVAISRYWGRHGEEATGHRLQEAVAAIRQRFKVSAIYDRILAARLEINRAAVERFEVHDDEAAEALMCQPTPPYPGCAADDAWLKANCGYGIRDDGKPMQDPPKRKARPAAREAQQEAAPGPRSREARAETRAALEEPEATAGMLIACLLDDPARIDAHYETLAALPCGRWGTLREVLLEQLGLPPGHPGADELRAAKLPAVAYTPAGWERAARTLAVRFPPDAVPG